jgi:hypothetical protein
MHGSNRGLLVPYNGAGSDVNPLRDYPLAAARERCAFAMKLMTEVKLPLDGCGSSAYTELTKHRFGGNVIQKNLVYHKSAKGTEAIATRQHGLTPKLRSMLILIDGKRGFEELAKLSHLLGDTEQLLGQLFDQGFIEPGSAAAPSTTPASSAPAPLAAAAHHPISLTEAQRFAVRRLTDIMGPNAEELCLRIEAARNVHDLHVAVARAEGTLRQFVNSHAAAEFMADIQAHMPAG